MINIVYVKINNDIINYCDIDKRNNRHIAHHYNKLLHMCKLAQCIKLLVPSNMLMQAKKHASFAG